MESQTMTGYWLSPQQERVCSFQAQAGSPYVVQRGLELKGDFDESQLRTAMLHVIERHERVSDAGARAHNRGKARHDSAALGFRYAADDQEDQKHAEKNDSENLGANPDPAQWRCARSTCVVAA